MEKNEKNPLTLGPPKHDYTALNHRHDADAMPCGLKAYHVSAQYKGPFHFFYNFFPGAHLSTLS